MIHETKKIMLNDMDAKDIKVTATCVRVPVPIAHGESIYFTVDDPTVTVDQLRAVLKDAPGVVLQDDPAHQVYPQPINAVGKRDISWCLRADEKILVPLICGLLLIISLKGRGIPIKCRTFS